MDYIPLPDNLLTNAGLSVVPLLSFLNKNRQEITHKTELPCIYLFMFWGGKVPVYRVTAPRRSRPLGLLFGAALHHMRPYEQRVMLANRPGGFSSVCEWYPSVSCQCQ